MVKHRDKAQIEQKTWLDNYWLPVSSFECTSWKRRRKIRKQADVQDNNNSEMKEGYVATSCSSDNWKAHSVNCYCHVKLFIYYPAMKNEPTFDCDVFFLFFCGKIALSPPVTTETLFAVGDRPIGAF